MTDLSIEIITMSDLSVGVCVRCQGLVRNTEMNGLHGIILQSHPDNGGTTWSVRFDGRAAHHWIPASHLERVAGTHNRAHRSATPPRSHTVLVIDNSGSMKNQDVQPGVAGGGRLDQPPHCSL